jgi:RHS repeat-associated protein
VNVPHNFPTISFELPLLAYSSDHSRTTSNEQTISLSWQYAQARYQSSVQGRFTSIDPLGGSARTVDPQSLNRYAYVLNNPSNRTDPSGMMEGLTYHYREADLSWSDVSGSFWGRPDISTAGRRDIGCAHIAQATYRLDNLESSDEEEEDANPSDDGDGVREAQSSYSDSNSVCSLQVRFDGILSPSTPQFSDGPDHRALGEYVGRLGEYTTYSFRFEVTGHVNSSRIGHVGIQAVPGGGEWAVGQDKIPHTFRNGKPGIQNDHMSDDSPRYLHGRWTTSQTRPQTCITCRNRWRCDLEHEECFGTMSFTLPSPNDPPFGCAFTREE